MFAAEEVVFLRFGVVLRVVKHLDRDVRVRRLQTLIRVGTCEGFVKRNLQVVEGVSQVVQYRICAKMLADGKKKCSGPTDGDLRRAARAFASKIVFRRLSV